MLKEDQQHWEAGVACSFHVAAESGDTMLPHATRDANTAVRRLAHLSMAILWTFSTHFRQWCDCGVLLRTQSVYCST